MHFYLCLALLSASATLPLSTTGQELEAVKCLAEFPTEREEVSGIYYTGEDEGSIYLFGGYDFDMSYDTVFSYNVAEDSLSFAGSLLDATIGSALAVDAVGNIYHFGGYGDTGYLDAIYRFNPTSGSIDLAGRLPQGMMTIGVIRQQDQNVALLFGEFEIFEVNLSTLQVNKIGDIPSRSAAIAWDGIGDMVLIFGTREHLVYSIQGNNFSSLPIAEPHIFFPYNAVVSTSSSALILGVSWGEDEKVGGIVEVNFESLESKFWPVANFPSRNNTMFVNTAAAYVPELHRLYMFGGTSPYGVEVMKDIWYINLPMEGEDTTTTEGPSPIFDCSDRPDGYYPSPISCEGYFQCLDGHSFEFECPPPLHFNPVLQVCDLPNDSLCDLNRIDL